MLNPKPILIAVCCAIAIIIGIYFMGQGVFETEGISNAPPMTSTPKNAEPTGFVKDNTQTVNSNPRHKTLEELHKALEGTDKNTPLQRLEALEKRNAERQKRIAKREQTIARLKAQQKARQEKHEREMAEIEEINRWIQTEILPRMNALLPDLTFFFDDGAEPSTKAFLQKYPDPADQRYYLNKFAQYEHYLDQLTTRVANASDNFRNRFLKVGVQLWGEEATEYLAREINRKRGE